MKSKIPLSAEINMSTIHDGLSNTNQIISTLNRTKSLPNIPYETSKLVDIMVNTATFQVKMARDILERYQMTDNTSSDRVKRGVHNPLQAVGRFAEWAFGLTTQEHFEEVKNSFEKNLNSLRNDDKLLGEAVKENSKELEDYTELLKQFDNFLKNISANDDSLVKNDLLFLKLLKHKFDLDLLMDSIQERLTMLSEILDQADLGLASRFMFSEEILKSQASRVSGTFPGLKAVFSGEKVDEYFSLPLTLTHFNNQTVRSLLRLPLQDLDAVFVISHRSDAGLVRLESSKYWVLLKVSQYKRCVAVGQTGQRLCTLRPCLIRSQDQEVTCIALNDTRFLIRSSGPLLVTTSCPGQPQHVTSLTNLSSITLPLHCRLESQQFQIRQTLGPSLQGPVALQLTPLSDHEDLHLLTDHLHHVPALPSHLQPLLGLETYLHQSQPDNELQSISSLS